MSHTITILHHASHRCPTFGAVETGHWLLLWRWGTGKDRPADHVQQSPILPCIGVQGYPHQAGQSMKCSSPLKRFLYKTTQCRLSFSSPTTTSRSSLTSHFFSLSLSLYIYITLKSFDNCFLRLRFLQFSSDLPPIPCAATPPCRSTSLSELPRGFLLKAACPHAQVLPGACTAWCGRGL